MRSFRLLSPVLLTLVLAACAPDPEPVPPAGDAAGVADKATAEAPADPLLAGTDASAVVRHEARDPDGFDRKAFAGSFAGILPCADCPGIEMQLEIDADGGFLLRETYQERDTSVGTRGTWTVAADGQRLLLDPDAKEKDDRAFRIVSSDELRLLGSEGQAIDSALNYSLRRH